MSPLQEFAEERARLLQAPRLAKSRAAASGAELVVFYALNTTSTAHAILADFVTLCGKAANVDIASKSCGRQLAA